MSCMAGAQLRDSIPPFRVRLFLEFEIEFVCPLTSRRCAEGMMRGRRAINLPIGVLRREGKRLTSFLLRISSYAGRHLLTIGSTTEF